MPSGLPLRQPKHHADPRGEIHLAQNRQVKGQSQPFQITPQIFNLVLRWKWGIFTIKHRGGKPRILLVHPPSCKEWHIVVTEHAGKDGFSQIFSSPASQYQRIALPVFIQVTLPAESINESTRKPAYPFHLISLLTTWTKPGEKLYSDCADKLKAVPFKNTACKTAYTLQNNQHLSKITYKSHLFESMDSAFNFMLLASEVATTAWGRNQSIRQVKCTIWQLLMLALSTSKLSPVIPEHPGTLHLRPRQEIMFRKGILKSALGIEGFSFLTKSWCFWPFMQSSPNMYNAKSVEKSPWNMVCQSINI